MPLNSARPSSSSLPTMSSKTFNEAVQERRSYYQLNKKSPISDAQIEEIVKNAILHTPSSFNSQSTRLVVLLHADHDKFWELTKEVLKPKVPDADQFAATLKKLDGFKSGYGTVLFFEDPDPIQKLQTAFPVYADKFPQWSEHTSAMHQFVLWTGLQAVGLGCNLQHYNPVVDQRAQQEWNVPLTWSLKAQLVFGGRAGEPGEKQFKPIEERLFVHGVRAYGRLHETECPNIIIVFGRYSQRAPVMHNAVTASTVDVKREVVAGVLFGDSRFVADGGKIKDYPAEQIMIFSTKEKNSPDTTCVGKLPNAGHFVYTIKRKAESYCISCTGKEDRGDLWRQ
ncbi:hypothetical protein FKW77_010218 [Venturia effusa]|uniref:Nitroreductase domain-containing protein n=1 Tax=Venturia effusa TaxID=50376 RepID=A0A517L2B5_9PEZI|nr:hypothetical protein FKW77_010218 [Venturia effusa]